MPDARMGELGGCFATLNAGKTFTFEDMIDSLVQNKMAKTYWPERLEIV